MQASFLNFPLTSNGYPLDLSEERFGWLVPSDPATSINHLREQYHEQGYLWLKGILPRKKIMEFRRRFFTSFLSTGLVKADTDPEEGIYSGGGEDRVAINKALMTIVRSAAYEAFCLIDEIWQFYDVFLEGDSYLHKRKLIRHTRPNDPNCTGGHYDLIYLRGGTDRLCTSWIPIGDTPVEMGGLIYLEGSAQWGRQMEIDYHKNTRNLKPAERVSAYNKYMDNTNWMTKDLPGLAERLNTRWLAANYEAGDMVIHSAYMIHASTVNHDSMGRMRLSTDIRYQRVKDEIDVRWQNHWSFDDML